MTQHGWTLAAALALGGVAHADSGTPAAADMAGESIAVAGSHRGVAQDYLVLPSGGELTAQMRFVTSDAMLERRGIEFSDLALFGISGRWSLFTKLELAASVELLPKQPSFTDEKPWQSVAFSLRSPLGRHVALELGGAGGHLLAHQGMWTGESLAVEWKKPVHEDFLAFDIKAGVDGLGVSSPNMTKSSAYLTEVALQTTALFHEPKGHWGAWLGIAYAVPVQFSGKDPTTELAIDPQPRLDFHMGTVLSAVKQWDIYVDFAVLDRGDRENAATRLPILDGGFDQKQIVFGVTRHIDAGRRHADGYDDDGGAVRLGSL